MGVFFNDIDEAEKSWYQNLYIQMGQFKDDPNFITVNLSLRTFSCYVELHRNGLPSPDNLLNPSIKNAFHLLLPIKISKPKPSARRQRRKKSYYNTDTNQILTGRIFRKMQKISRKRV